MPSLSATVGSAPLLGPLVALNAWTLGMEAWVCPFPSHHRLTASPTNPSADVRRPHARPEPRGREKADRNLAQDDQGTDEFLHSTGDALEGGQLQSLDGAADELLRRGACAAVSGRTGPVDRWSGVG